MKNKAKWLVFSIAGLILTGAGLSIFGEASHLKYQSPANQDWIWWGTLSLVIFNTGLSFIGQAVIFKLRADKTTAQQNTQT